MKPTIAILAAAISLAAYSTLGQANTDADYEAAVKQAKADYSAAKEACESMKGNDKDVCLKQAKADYTAATQNAKVEKKSVGSAGRRRQGDDGGRIQSRKREVRRAVR